MDKPRLWAVSASIEFVVLARSAEEALAHADQQVDIEDGGAPFVWSIPRMLTTINEIDKEWLNAIPYATADCKPSVDRTCREWLIP